MAAVHRPGLTAACGGDPAAGHRDRAPGGLSEGRTGGAHGSQSPPTPLRRVTDARPGVLDYGLRNPWRSPSIPPPAICTSPRRPEPWERSVSRRRRRRRPQLRWAITEGNHCFGAKKPSAISPGHPAAPRFFATTTAHQRGFRLPRRCHSLLVRGIILLRLLLSWVRTFRFQDGRRGPRIGGAPSPPGGAITTSKTGRPGELL